MAHGAHRIGKAEGSGNDVGGVFAQGMAGDKAGGEAGLVQHARGGDGNGENRRLGDLRKPEFFLRPLEAELAERVSERLVGFFKNAAGGGMIMSEFLTHSSSLRALAGEE